MCQLGIYLRLERNSCSDFLYVLFPPDYLNLCINQIIISCGSKHKLKYFTCLCSKFNGDSFHNCFFYFLLHALQADSSLRQPSGILQYFLYVGSFYLNRGSFTSSFPIWIPCGFFCFVFFFTCLTTLARTYSIILNSTGNCILVLFLNLGGNFHLSPLSMRRSLGF